MQPRTLEPVPAAAAELAGALDELLLDDEAELVLLPHAATTSVADTASAAVAHALCFTLTSMGQALAAPGLAFVLGCPAGYARLSRLGRGHASI
jgi:hypothetical protein